MTVKLTRQFGEYPSNSIVTLDRATEAALIAGNAATTNTAGGAQWAGNGLFSSSPRVASINISGDADSVTAQLQSALNVGGIVQVLTPGTFEINDTLLIGDETHFVLSPQTTIRLANNTNKAMLMAKSVATMFGGTSITISWTAGAVATVTWAAHGLIDADYVWIRGAAQTEYNSVFRVGRVLTADTFEIVLNRTPSAAASGTILGVRCTRNFFVTGGVWDGNRENNGAVGDGYTYNILFSLYAAANFTIRDVQFQDFRRGITTGAVADYLVENCTYVGNENYPCEGHKTYGPVNGGTLRNLVIRSTDDGMSIQPKEAPAFSWTGIPFGDIYNLTVDTVNAQSMTSAAGGALLVYASDNEVVEGLTVKNANLYCAQGSGLILKYGDTFSTGKINSARFENINAKTNTPSTQYALSVSCNVDNLMLVNFVPVPGNYTNTIMRTQSTATIKSLVFDGMRLENTGLPSSAGNMFTISGVVDSLVLRNCVIRASQTNATFIALTAAVNSIVLDTCDIQNVSRILNVNTGTLLNYTVRDCYIANVASVIEPRSTATPTRVGLYNNIFSTVTTGVVRPSTGTGVVCKIYGAGNTFSSATPVAATGSATFEVYTFDIAVDPITVTGLATTNGQFLTSTQAATEGGPTVRSAAGWVALGTGASGVNTVIV